VEKTETHHPRLVVSEGFRILQVYERLMWIVFALCVALYKHRFNDSSVLDPDTLTLTAVYCKMSKCPKHF